MGALEQVIVAFVKRGDIGHLGLLLWAAAASGFAFLLLREIAVANKRFDAFVRELDRFNARHEENWP